MSNPAGIKKLWKNIDWKSKEEKFAFYNKYFKNSEFVKRDIDKAVKKFKDDIIAFIDMKEIKEGDKTRLLNMNDVIGKIKNG